MVSALLAVVLSTSAFSVTAFASGGEESTESVAEQETAGDVSDLLSALAGSQVTVSVTEGGIQFSSGENDSGQTGTVTTGGGNLNVRTGAGMDYTAFTQLPNGTTVKVIGTDGDRLKVTVRFRGREMAHTNLGNDLLDRFKDACEEYGSVDKMPKMEGRSMVMFISSKPKK